MIWAGRNLKGHLMPPPVYGQGHFLPDQVPPSPAQPGLANVTSQKQKGENPPKIITNPAIMEKIKGPCPSCASSAVLLHCPPWPMFRAAAKNTPKMRNV